MTRIKIPKPLLLLVIIYTAYSLLSLITMSSIYLPIILLAIVIGLSARYSGALIGLRVFVGIQIFIAAILLMYLVVYSAIEIPENLKTFSELSGAEITLFYLFLAFQCYAACSKKTRMYVERT